MTIPAYLRAVLLALLSALLLILSFPRFDFEFLAWIALVPLFVALKDKSLKWAFALSFLMGISFLMGVFYWINVISGFKWNDFLILGIYLGSYFGIFGLGLNFIRQRTNLHYSFAAPFLWVSMEYLRSHAGFLGLPWALLGHSQYLNLAVIQVASITGVYGVTFLIVLVNATMGGIIQNPAASLKPAMVTLFIVGISVSYGFVVMGKDSPQKEFRVSVVQGNIPQRLKWDPEWRKRNLEKHIGLTKEVTSKTSTSLVVWSEASVPGALSQDLYLLNTLSNLAKETGGHLLLGSSVHPKFGSREFRQKNWFNSAFLVSPQRGVAGQYMKIHLLPFSEYLPYRDAFPWPERWASAGGDFIPGKEYTIFDVDGAKFGVVICWENIFPDLVRQFVKKGASFMINITNEGWFGETSAPQQFLAMTVFRAVENRRSIARSANTGISGFIDPYGRILAKVEDHNRKDIFVEGHVTADVPLFDGKTFYTMYGDVWAYINLIATTMMLALSLRRPRHDVP